jgi:formylglycine-generating enzyme required for sulfatase activity
MDNPAAARSAYEDAVQPVDRLPEGNRDLNPAGLYHTLGNVAEWTESIPYTVNDVGLNPMPGWRIIKGDNWSDEGFDALKLSDYRMHPTHVRGIAYGFRCAKSAGP